MKTRSINAAHARYRPLVRGLDVGEFDVAALEPVRLALRRVRRRRGDGHRGCCARPVAPTTEAPSRDHPHVGRASRLPLSRAVTT